MAQCEMCGNDYDKPIQVTMAGVTHIFDSFECAIHALAPVCAHCGCRVIGHGIEADNAFFCCAHCARQSGVQKVQDRTTEKSMAFLPHGHHGGKREAESLVNTG